MKLQTDEPSFRRGLSFVGSVAGAIGKLIESGAGLAAAGIAFTALMAKYNQAQAQMNVTAMEAGINTDQLNNWKNVMHIVGGDADDMTSSLKKLASTTADLRRTLTPAPQWMIDAFSVLGLDQSQWMNMDASELAKTIIDNAVKKIRAGGNRVTILNALREVMGESAVTTAAYEFFNKLSTAELQASAATITFTDALQRFNAMQTAMDFNKLTGAFREMRDLFAMKFMMAIDPELRQLLDYVVTHKQDIVGAISAAASALGDFATEISPLLGALTKFFGVMFAGMEGVAYLASVLRGKPMDLAAVQRQMKRLMPFDIDVDTRTWWGYPTNAEGIRGMAFAPENRGRWAIEVYNRTGLALEFKQTVKEGTERIHMMHGD